MGTSDLESRTRGVIRAYDTGNSVTEFDYLRLSCQGFSSTGYQAGMSDGEGVASAKREAQAQILDMLQWVVLETGKKGAGGEFPQ